MSAFVAIQEFISKFQVLFLSLGVPILTMLISWYVSVQGNRTSRGLAGKERFLAVELKLAEFRQLWINELRADLAMYFSETFNIQDRPLHDDALRNVIALGSRITMRMNPADPDYAALQQALSDVLPSSDDQKSSGGIQSVTKIGQLILKREWKRLKDDLRRIDGGETP